MAAVRTLPPARRVGRKRVENGDNRCADAVSDQGLVDIAPSIRA